MRSPERTKFTQWHRAASPSPHRTRVELALVAVVYAPGYVPIWSLVTYPSVDLEVLHIRSGAHFLRTLSATGPRPPPGNLPREYGRARDIRRGETPVNLPGNTPTDPPQSTKMGKPAESPQEFPQGTWQGYHWAPICPNCCWGIRPRNPDIQIFSWFSARAFNHYQSANAIPPHIHSTGAMAPAERLNYYYTLDMTLPYSGLFWPLL